MLVTYPTCAKISQKFVQNFWVILWTDRQTNKDNITSLAEETI